MREGGDGDGDGADGVDLTVSTVGGVSSDEGPGQKSIDAFDVVGGHEHMTVGGEEGGEG